MYSMLLQDTFSEVQDQSSYVADIAYYSSSGEYEVPAGESLNRGGRFRSSLPIVRTRSRSRERPLGELYVPMQCSKMLFKL